MVRSRSQETVEREVMFFELDGDKTYTADTITAKMLLRLLFMVV